MSSTSNTVEEIYLSVVNDVIAQCKESFLDDNVDLEVLTQLKEEWWGKLKQSGCVDYTPPQRPLTSHMIRPSQSTTMLLAQTVPPAQTQQGKQQQTSQQQVISGGSGLITTTNNGTNANNNPAPVTTSQITNSIISNLQQLNAQTNQQPFNNLLAVQQRQNGTISQPIMIQPTGITTGGQVVYLNANSHNLSSLLTSNGGTITCGIAAQPGASFASMLHQAPRNEQINLGTNTYNVMTSANLALNQTAANGIMQNPSQQILELIAQRTIVSQTHNISNNGNENLNQSAGNVPQLDGSIILPDVNTSMNQITVNTNEIPIKKDIQVKRTRKSPKSKKIGLSKKDEEKLIKAFKKHFIVQLDGSNTGHMSDSDSDDEEGNEDGLIQYATEDTEIGDEDDQEDPLNSGDDQSDDEDVVKLFESENIIMCQFEKVSRTRTKWKFNLKDGIMHINGKDYCFQKCSGEAEW
uniref:Transcription initiation factor IIA subunit 1 n=1 Tax=Parastrongyloides trichosuri TaxID=131310 RepID=A0A0N4Z5L5_PARTI